MSSLADQEKCNHLLAKAFTHRCPECNGIMRRCCQSTIGCNHAQGCMVLEAARKKKEHNVEFHEGV